MASEWSYGHAQPLCRVLAWALVNGKRLRRDIACTSCSFSRVEYLMPMSVHGTLRILMPPPGMSVLRGKADIRGATLYRPLIATQSGHFTQYACDSRAAR